MATFFFPTCLFSKTLTDDSDFSDLARAAFDWNPDTWEVAADDATTRIVMDRNSTGRDKGNGFLEADDTITFHAVVFPYYDAAWVGGSIAFTTNSAAAFNGSSGYGATTYFTALGSPLFAIQSIGTETRRYVRWQFSVGSGLYVAVAMVMVGRHGVVPCFNWGEQSSLYTPGTDIAAGDGVCQILTHRSTAYRRRVLTFEFISPAQYELLRDGFSTCCGAALPFFLMEDDGGDPMDDCVMYRFLPDSFQYSSPAAELYNVTLAIEEYPRIPVLKTVNTFRSPF